MTPHSQAVRGAQAWDRIVVAIAKQAKAGGVRVNGLDATHRDPALQQLFRMEALADYLEGASQPEVTHAKSEKGRL